MTCSILKCRAESVLIYGPCKVDLCAVHWETFAELPLMEALAWLHQNTEKQLKLGVQA